MQLEAALAGVKRRITPRTAVTILVLSLLAIVALTYRSYGFTTDEANGVVRAHNIWNYFASAGIDSENISAFHPRNFYGAMPDVLALALMEVWPAGGLDLRHLVAALFGVAGIYYTYRLGEHLGGRWVGVAAAGFLTLTPMWFGYMFINLKDIPFAASFIAANYYGLKVLADARRPGAFTMLGLSLWTGALASCKLTGILLLGFSLLVLLGFWCWQNGRPTPARFALRALLAAALGVVGVAVFAFFFWPQLFIFSPEQVFKALLQFLNYDPWQGGVLLDGRVYDQDHVPRHYLVTYLLITMPLLTLALGLFGAASSIVRRDFALLGAVVLPVLFLAIQAATDAQVYNGFRQFLFTLPFICIGAGYGLVSFGRIGRRAVAQPAAVLVFVAFAVWSAITMASLFPYQYSAYNALVGGTSGAQNRYYIDVWRSAEREALHRLEALLPAGSPPVRVNTCGSALNFREFPRLIRVRGAAEPADYAIRLPRCSPNDPEGFEVIAQVRRGDVLFATVLRPVAAASAAN